MKRPDTPELIQKIQTCVDNILSSLNKLPLNEAKEKYPKIMEIITKYKEIRMSIPDDLIFEKEKIEELISISHEKDILISMADELPPLVNDIKSQTNDKSNSRRAATKLKVKFPDGFLICEKSAKATLKMTIQRIGLERVSELKWIKEYKYPLVSKYRNNSNASIHKIDDYYIDDSCCTSNKEKKRFLDKISSEFKIDLTIEIIDK